jgi:hypothetical protein
MDPVAAQHPHEPRRRARKEVGMRHHVGTSTLAAASVLAVLLLLVSAAPVLAQASAGPTTPILDDFERPDENPLFGGGNWAKLNPSVSFDLELTAGAAETAPPGGGQPRRYWTPRTFGPNVELWVRASRMGQWHQDVRLDLRVQNAGTSSWRGYELVANWNGIFGYGWWLRRINGDGTFTDLATADANLQSGWIVFRAQGSALEVWISGTGSGWQLLLSASDSTFSAPGHVAIGLGTGADVGGPRIEEVGAGTIAGPSPATQSYGTDADGNGVHGKSGTGMFADPVNSLTGAFTTAVDDLALPGTGVSFAWSRSYTSADTTVGRLGPG